jgi:hypothetical protein
MSIISWTRYDIQKAAFADVRQSAKNSESAFSPVRLAVTQLLKNVA